MGEYKNNRLEKLYMVLLYLFLYAPILVMVAFSFNAGKTRGVWEGFSLKWYLSLFQNEEILHALRTTLLVALVSTLAGTLIGVLGVLVFYYAKPAHRRWMRLLNQVIVINPDIVTAVGFMILYRLMQLDLGFFSLLLSHIGFTVPYVVISILPRLQQMPSSLPEAAMDLGATPLQTILYVILPYIKSGILSGAVMAFTVSIDDFVISFFTSGNGVNTVSTLVYSMARRGINPEINALSTIMLVAMFFLLMGVGRRPYASRKEKRKKELAQREMK